MTNKKTKIFDEITRELGQTLQNVESFSKLIFAKRNQVRKIISKNEELKKEYESTNHINRFLFLADYREYLWLPRYMDLDIFNAFTEKIMTSWEEIDYDYFLKTFKKSKPKTKLPKWYKWPEVGKLIKNQWEYIAQWIVELVANAIDATSSEKTIWRFGEWFYQALKFLKWWNAELKVKSKKSWEKWFLLSLVEQNWVNKVWSVWVEKQSSGTEIELKKELNEDEIESLKAFVINAFKTNKRVNIFLNWDKLNNLWIYNYYNWELLQNPTESVYIEINENWFKVIDNWVWMSAEDLSEKLLQPQSTWKKRVNPDAMSDQELEKNTLGETAFFYKRFEGWKKEIKKSWEKIMQKTEIRLQVWGVLIESFEGITSYDISEFCLELPSFSWVPESRNEIQLTREVVVSLKHILEKISLKVEDDREKIMLLEIVWKIIKHLKSRESSKVSTKSKYDIDKVAKEEFKKLKENLESKGKTILPAIPGLQKILSGSDDIVFVDPIFLNFDVKKIPWVQKLKNIKNAKVSFYQIDFSEEAEYDYLIGNWFVLVNAKYTGNQDDLDKINAQVNLNTGYEKWDDIVFYGVIEDDESVEGKENIKLKDSISEWENQNINQKQLEEYVNNLKRLLEEFWEFFSEHTIKVSILEPIEYINNNINISRQFILDCINLSYEKIVFLYLCNTNTRVWDSEKIIWQNFYEKFYNFALENSKEILGIFRKFTLKIQDISNPEKYLLQIMELLNDEKNAKYIAEYLDEFDDLSESDIKTLFAHFEWEEVEEEEKESENKALLAWKTHWSSWLYNYVKSWWNWYQLTAHYIEYNDNILYMVLNKDWKFNFYLWDKLFEVAWKKDFERVRSLKILNNNIVVVEEYTNWMKIYYWDNLIYNWKKVWDISFENWFIKWGGTYFEVIEIDVRKFDKKPESEYLRIYRERWRDELKKYIKNKLLQPHEKVISVYEYNWTIAYIVEAWMPAAYKFYIWEEQQEIDGRKIYRHMDRLSVIKWKIFLEFGDDWKFYYWWKIYKFSDIVWEGDVKIQSIESSKWIIAIFHNSDLVFINLNTLETQKPESEYLRIYREEGRDKLYDYIFSKLDIEWVNHPQEINWNILFQVQNKNWTFSLYYWDKQIWIKGKLEFENLANFYHLNDWIIKIWYVKIDWIEYNHEFEIDLSWLKSNNSQLNLSNYSPKTLAFIEFLCKWWEFLAEKDREIIFESTENLALTDIIWISKNFPDDIEDIPNSDEKTILQELKRKITQELKDRTLFGRQITSTIDGQDRSSMIWLREVVQNSRDAILKAKRNGNNSENIDEVNIDFYQNNWNWISKITDNIWMTPYEVFKYLLTPGKSGKQWDETATWMFGQWFYSLAIWASEVNVKTSTGNWKTTYIKLIPIYSENHDLIDFDINYDIKDEQFTWTVIERVDEEKWVWWNIWALVWLQNMSKYVWNVDDIRLNYNWKNIFNSSDVKLLQTEKVWNLWTLSLKQNKDKKERFTKDNLFISDIKDWYTNFFPDWIREYVKSGWYSLDLPSWIELTKTRNAVSDFEEDIEILRPHIFNIFTRQIVKDYLDHKFQIPMMPLDYMWLDMYEREFSREIVWLAEKVNNGWVLTLEDIQKLQDKNALVQYLICLQIESKWEKISIRELKKKRDDELALRKHTNNPYIRHHDAESLNATMENWDRQELYVKDDNEKKEFLSKVQERFWKLTKRLFGCEIEFWFYKRQDKDEIRAVDYGFDRNWNIYFNFNVRFWEEYKTYENYKIIELVTHEFTHLVENKTNFWTHQKDLLHEDSFEKNQRDILRMMTREKL